MKEQITWKHHYESSFCCGGYFPLKCILRFLQIFNFARFAPHFTEKYLQLKIWGEAWAVGLFFFFSFSILGGFFLLFNWFSFCLFFVCVHRHSIFMCIWGLRTLTKFVAADTMHTYFSEYQQHMASGLQKSSAQNLGCSVMRQMAYDYFYSLCCKIS